MDGSASRLAQALECRDQEDGGREERGREGEKDKIHRMTSLRRLQNRDSQYRFRGIKNL